MRGPALPRLRISAAALALATLGWAAGCATAPVPLADPAIANRTYTPARIALLPPDVFVVYDEAGDNDPQKSAALGREVAADVARLAAEGLRARGYDVDFSARWDGVHGADGQILVPAQELGWLANAILSFSNIQPPEARGAMREAAFVAPEIAARVGWAARSDALLYLNLKGVAVSPGKRTAQILGAAVVVAFIVAMFLIATQDRGGGRKAPQSGAGTGQARGMGRAPAPAVAAGAGGGTAAGPGALAPAAGGATGALAVPRGSGRAPSGGGGRTYRGGGGGVGLGLGIGVMVPIGGPVHTHDGTVAEQDEIFAGDDASISATLVSTHDGRVLWHLAESLDVELDNPEEVAALVRRVLGTLPLSLAGAAGRR